MNSNYKRRDEIIWGVYDPERYKSGGCCRFYAPAEKAQQLVEEGFIELNETQNESPSTEEFMNSIVGYEDWVEFECYAISPERDDYRVTIEGINIWIPIDKRDDMCRFVEEFRYADEFNINSDENGFHLRAWWD